MLRINLIIALLLAALFNCTAQTTPELIFNNPPFAQCHSSSVVELKSGRLLVACFGGSGEGQKDVGIWITEKTNHGWLKPKEIATGKQNDSLQYPCWNPVLFETATGQLFLYYKVGPSPQKW